MTGEATGTGLRRTVLIVAILNLAYFGVEFAVALKIGSVSLFADSVDFLEDASLNLLIFFALASSAATRARVGMVMAGIILVPALALLWALWSKFTSPVPPEPSHSPRLGAARYWSICPVPTSWRGFAATAAA